MTEIEEIFLEHRPVICESCMGKMEYKGSGEYTCRECGEEQLDDFGKIKKFLEGNPGSSTVQIANETGVELEIVRMFLKDGRISIPEGSRIFIKCERCGCSLRHGRYCIECTQEMAGQLRGAFYESAGEKPAPTEYGRQRNRMRYF